MEGHNPTVHLCLASSSVAIASRFLFVDCSICVQLFLPPTRQAGDEDDADDERFLLRSPDAPLLSS